MTRWFPDRIRPVGMSEFQQRAYHAPRMAPQIRVVEITQEEGDMRVAKETHIRDTRGVRVEHDECVILWESMMRESVRTHRATHVGIRILAKALGIPLAKLMDSVKFGRFGDIRPVRFNDTKGRSPVGFMNLPMTQRGGFAMPTGRAETLPTGRPDCTTVGTRPRQDPTADRTRPRAHEPAQSGIEFIGDKQCEVAFSLADVERIFRMTKHEEHRADDAS